MTSAQTLGALCGAVATLAMVGCGGGDTHVQPVGPPSAATVAHTTSPSLRKHHCRRLLAIAESRADPVRLLRLKAAARSGNLRCAATHVVIDQSP
jgi:hypothetical protein